MANYYLDFVGLNTFIYEPVGYDPENQISDTSCGTPTSGRECGTRSGNSMYVIQNHVGVYNADNEIYFQSLPFSKNFKFGHILPDPKTGVAATTLAELTRATASFFPALMLHRNGPYGHPTWKQVRVGKVPLIRSQIKNSIFTHVEEPGPSVVILNSNTTKRYGDIKAFIEAPIISRFKPLAVKASTTDFPVDIRTSMGNSICHFNNLELDKYYGFENCSNEEYRRLKKIYLDGALENEDSLIDEFSMLTYSETIYPTQLYTNKNYTRQRTTFFFRWRDSFSNRIETGVDNGFGTTVSQSIWPLDVPTEAPSKIWQNSGKLWSSGYGYDDASDYAFGILQNNYSIGDSGLDTSVDNDVLNDVVRPAPIYNRKHTITPLASVVSKNGMKIQGVNYSATFGDLNFTNDIPSGEAKWEAGDQAGKNPFYDSYDEYIQGPRQRGKGYTIIPEFRISNHIETIVAESVNKKFINMFEMTGGLSSADGSSESNFYKIYSTSEFLKHFDLIREDHKDFVEPTKIKLKCKAIKKFLPYNGFYPCQRTVDIAKQFYSSYKKGISVATGSTPTFTPLESGARIALQNLLTPLFAPGVLFNSIKSGVACDYPITTGSVTIANNRILQDTNDYYLRGPTTALGAAMTSRIFEKRVPFGALIEPQRYLSNQQLFCNEPHINANHSSSCFWDGTGDNLYKMMAHNFLAEVPEFFLQGQQFSTIYSMPSNDPKVGNAIKDTTYKMRVKMYKTVNEASMPMKSGSSTPDDSYFTQPQYDDSAQENFTMYSRPSAFGPPSRTEHSLGSGLPYAGSRSDLGENYPFTPPYYYGQAWADIEFTPEQTRKYTLDEIIRESRVTYFRFVHESYETGSLVASGTPINQTEQYNVDAMQLSASVNLFGLAEIKSVDLLDDSTSDRVNVAVDISSDNKARWVIQPYFETPMLNFNHLSASNSVELPANGRQSVPRGMWHQYGKIETDSSKGIFLQVTDVPDDWRTKVSGSIFDRSLKNLCGFRNEPRRLGQIADSKVISEGVVAIPFVEEEGERKFFKIDRESVNFAIRARSMADDGAVGKSVLHMVDMMRKFVIPPSLDFVHRQGLEPFAMYIFEFNHTLDQQDLADIWQNLPPTIGQSFEEAEVTIAHDLLADELLGGGELTRNKQRKKGPPLPDRIKWMVFKVKQRAEANYYNKIIGEQSTLVQGTKRKDFTTRRLAKQAASMLRPEGITTDVSYNWPYDFFSLVELVKIDAEVVLADTEVIKEEDNDIVPKKVNLREQIGRMNRQRGVGFRSRRNNTDGDNNR